MGGLGTRTVGDPLGDGDGVLPSWSSRAQPSAVWSYTMCYRRRANIAGNPESVASRGSRETGSSRVRRQCRGGLGIEILEFRNCNPSQSVSQSVELFHGPAPRSPLHRLAVRLRHSRSNTSNHSPLEIP